MQAFPLGSLKVLKECLFSYLSDRMQTSATMQYFSLQPKPLHVIQKPDLRLLNNFLVETEGHHMQFRIRLDFSKGRIGDGIAELFTDNRILGIIEAKLRQHRFCITIFWRNC